MQKDRYHVALPIECRDLVEKVRELIQQKSGLNVKISHAAVIATVLRVYVKENT